MARGTASPSGAAGDFEDPALTARLNLLSAALESLESAGEIHGATGVLLPGVHQASLLGHRGGGPALDGGNQNRSRRVRRVDHRGFCDPLFEVPLNQCGIASRGCQGASRQTHAVSLQRTSAYPCAARDGVPLGDGTLPNRPKERCPAQKLLRSVPDRHFLPPVAAKRVGGNPGMACQLPDRTWRGHGVTAAVARALDCLDQ